MLPTSARVILTVLLALLPLGIAYLFFVPIYQSNDDLALEMLASGRGISPEPTSFLLFVNVILGQLLSLLYVHVPGIPWYRGFMLAVQLAAGATIAWTALKRKMFAGQLVLLFTFFLTYSFYFYAHPHFTITAAVSAQAALLLWLDHLFRGEPLAGFGLFVFLALFTVAGLIRYESCLLMVLVALPTIVIASVRLRGALALEMPDGPRTKRVLALLRQAAFPLVAGVLVIESAQIYNDHCYATTPGWEDFYEFNTLRAEFTDYHRAHFSPETKPFFDDVGWSSNDFAMLKTWYFADESLFNVETFRRLLAAFPHRPKAELSRHLATNLLTRLIKDPSLSFLGAALVLPFAFVTPGRGRLTHLAVAVLSVALTSSLVVLLRHRLPPWVYTPMLAYVAGLALVLPEDDYLASGLSRLRIVLQSALLTLLLAAWLVAIVHHAKDAELARRLHDRLQRAVKELNPRPNQLYVLGGAPFPLEIITARDLEDWKDLKLLGLGFTTHSPVNRDRLREFHIDDIYAALLHRPDVFLIAQPPTMGGILTYLEDHYGVEVAAHAVVEMRLGKWAGYDVGESKSIDLPRDFAVFRFEILAKRQGTSQTPSASK